MHPTLLYKNYLDGLNLNHDSRQVILAKILNYFEHTNVDKIRLCDLIRISGIFLPRVKKAIKWLEKYELIKIDKTTPRETWISILDFEACRHEIDKTVKRNAIQDYPVDRVLKPCDIILEHKNFASSWDLRDYNYVHKLFQQIQIASNHGEDDIVDELSRGYERKIMRKYEGAYIPDIRQNPAPVRGYVV